MTRHSWLVMAIVGVAWNGKGAAVRGKQEEITLSRLTRRPPRNTAAWAATSPSTASQPP